MNRCSITAANGGLVIKTPYDPGLVAALKVNVPASDRKFDPGMKAWIVSPSYGQTLQMLIGQYFNEFVLLPAISTRATIETRLLEVHYLGQCKFRDSGESSAFAWINGFWNAIFPEDVLRNWFETGPAPIQPPDQANTLYAILGVAKTAGIDDIKTAFRRMARQWHPDVCKEPNAAEMFIRIKEASDILSDSRKRSRYDAGLALEVSLKQPKQNTQYMAVQGAYRSPLRCGWIMCEGQEVIGRFSVKKILAWEDITSGDLTLVVSWPLGADRPVEDWV
jgi:hypothetical protein